MKILVADDDKEIVELISIYLHNEGYEPVKAYDGKEALSKVRTTPDIELLILDIMMPEVDGMQVVKTLRKESQIPIIMLTAKTTDMDKIKGLVAGADDLIEKHEWQQHIHQGQIQLRLFLIQFRNLQLP